VSGSWQSGGEFHKGTCRCTGAVTVFASPLQPSPASAAAMPFALAALGVHTVAMLAAIAVISVAVYNFTSMSAVASFFSGFYHSIGREMDKPKNGFLTFFNVRLAGADFGRPE